MNVELRHSAALIYQGHLQDTILWLAYSTWLDPGYSSVLTVALVIF